MNTDFNNWKINILGLNENSFIIFLNFMNIKIIYVKVLMKLIHKYKIKDILKFGILNKNLLTKIKKLCCLKVNTISKETLSSDNTIKWLIKISEKNYIEVVAIPNKKNQYTLCISSQIGCVLNCSFCYTGKQGFVRNLKSYEIISQIYQATRRLDLLFLKKKITNIVMMGMGEPLLNINNVLSAFKIIICNYTYNININKTTISTSGIISEMEKLNNFKIPLAVSLHFTDNKKRSDFMPINRKYSIKNLLNMCKKYSVFNKLTIEYIMIKGINDSIQDALKLSALLFNINCKICLIPFNNFNKSSYVSSDKKQILLFKDILQKNGKITTIRKKYGYDINAACGQLAGFVNNVVN